MQNVQARTQEETSWNQQDPNSTEMIPSLCIIVGVCWQPSCVKVGATYTYMSSKQGQMFWAPEYE